MYKNKVDKTLKKEMIRVPPEYRKRKVLSWGDRYFIGESEFDTFGIERQSYQPFHRAFKTIYKAVDTRIKDLSLFVEMSTGYISSLIHGKAKPNMYIIERISLFYRIDPSYFIEYRIWLLENELRKEPVMIGIFYNIMVNGNGKKEKMGSSK
jgi:transcriptional regulator with XRE-family HTH domain